MKPILVVALLLPVLSLAAAAAAAERITLKKGAQCKALKPVGEDGVTHHCFFAPGVFGDRDYSNRNGRARYVFTELGPRCGEIEIVADEPHQDDGTALVRVSAVCSR
jgi:hypothetical protein